MIYELIKEKINDYWISKVSWHLIISLFQTILWDGIRIKVFKPSIIDPRKYSFVTEGFIVYFCFGISSMLRYVLSLVISLRRLIRLKNVCSLLFMGCGDALRDWTLWQGVNDLLWVLKLISLDFRTDWCRTRTTGTGGKIFIGWMRLHCDKF